MIDRKRLDLGPGQKDEDMTCKGQGLEMACKWLPASEEDCTHTQIGICRAFPTLGVLQATEVMGAP